MPFQLDLYNTALLFCGERFLASLTEAVETRRLLDHVWSTSGVRACLQQGQWAFATRTQQIDYDPSVEPSFGYDRAFTKPEDWVLTTELCSDEFFRNPLLRYVDEAGWWYSDMDTIYVRYVSDDAGYGLNHALWPDAFREFVAAHLASKIILKLSGDEAEEKKIIELREHKLREAKNVAMMAEPTRFPARGEWSRARNRFPNRRDGGNSSGNLY